MLVNDEFRKRGMSDAIDVDIYAAEPGPLGVAGPDVSDGVRNMVLQAGIGYFPDHQVVAVDADQQKVSFANGSTADFDVLAYIPPHRAPDVVRAAGMLEDTGWVAVDRETLQTGFPGVFAIGDITGIPLLLGKPLPKAGVFAERQAAVVAHNIAAEIAGDSDFKAFNGHGECFIEVGGHRAGFGKGNFYAEPTPQISLHKVGLRWHLGKLLFERNWLRRF
jgi:sulfide:quinone oxidoreductase